MSMIMLMLVIDNSINVLALPIAVIERTIFFKSALITPILNGIQQILASVTGSF